MNHAFNIGGTGLRAYSEYLNNIGNNLANVNTTGYKVTHLSFNDLLYTQMYVNAADTPIHGTGVKATFNGINFSQSGMKATGYPLDYGIVGNGLFCVQKGANRYYTRDGSFQLSVINNNSAYLVNSEGDYVLDKGGARIVVDVSGGADKIDYSALSAKIGVYKFANPDMLTPVAGNKYQANELSGAAALSTEGEYSLMRTYLEQSSTDVSDEMANMIIAQRAYQLSAKVVTTADENEQTVNSLRK